MSYERPEKVAAKERRERKRGKAGRVVRRLTQSGADDRSRKGTQRTQRGRCVEPAVKVGTASSPK
jgi:hypothetical protein